MHVTKEIQREIIISHTSYLTETHKYFSKKIPQTKTITINDKSKQCKKVCALLI